MRTIMPLLLMFVQSDLDSNRGFDGRVMLVALYGNITPLKFRYVDYKWVKPENWRIEQL